MKMVLCVLCGTRDASFVCHNCGRPVCHECFDTNRWWCRSCVNQPSSSVVNTPMRVPTTGLFFLAFVMIFVGILLMSLAPILDRGNIGSVGTVILIGPIPIILGSGPFASVIVVLALLLTIVALIFGVILQRRK